MITTYDDIQIIGNRTKVPNSVLTLKDIGTGITAPLVPHGSHITTLTGSLRSAGGLIRLTSTAARNAAAQPTAIFQCPIDDAMMFTMMRIATGQWSFQINPLSGTAPMVIKMAQYRGTNQRVIRSGRVTAGAPFVSGPQSNNHAYVDSDPMTEAEAIAGETIVLDLTTNYLGNVDDAPIKYRATIVFLAQNQFLLIIWRTT